MSLNEQAKRKFEIAGSYVDELEGGDYNRTQAMVLALEGLALTIAENTEVLKKSTYYIIGEKDGKME